MGLGERIAVMYEGKLRQIGPPREVYADPADTFVATFLGSPPMNLVGRGDHLLGFRPENLLPAELVSGNGDRVTASLEIARIEYLSGDRHIYGTVTGIGEETRVIARLPATVTTPLEAGDVREFAVPERDLRFFDAETGKRTAAQPVRA
jgi:multiple sugar transport system ATP-binding protein